VLLLKEILNLRLQHFHTEMFPIYISIDLLLDEHLVHEDSQSLCILKYYFIVVDLQRLLAYKFAINLYSTFEHQLCHDIEQNFHFERVQTEQFCIGIPEHKSHRFISI